MNVRYRGGLCCKSRKLQVHEFLAKKTKREAIADSYNLNRVAEVACEFNMRRRGPSHLYTKTAPIARGIFDQQRKTTFATQSGEKRTLHDIANQSFMTHRPTRAAEDFCGAN
jgi:hypothetical protein